jgi:hypothetical protein
MFRPSRRPFAPDRLGPIAGRLMRVVAAVAIVALAVAAAGCGPSAPLASIDTEPTPLPPFEAARLAFVDAVKAGDLTYHGTFDGRVYGAANDVAVVGSLDVAGADYQYAATYTLPDPATNNFAIRYVGGTAWEQINGGKWQTNGAFKPSDTNSPFAFITRPSEVKFARTETVDGRALHHVTFTTGQLIALSQIQAGNLTNEAYKRSTFDLVLDDDGNPVSGTAKIEGIARVSNQLQEIIVQVDLVFSKVGAGIVIKAP